MENAQLVEPAKELHLVDLWLSGGVVQKDFGRKPRILASDRLSRYNA